MGQNEFIANYMDTVYKQFKYYKLLGEKTFEQISDEELFWSHDPESNSISIIIKHLWGNMRSRWTDFLTTDGEKDFRDRESEFIDDIKSREELLRKWEAGWATLFKALDHIDDSNFDQLIYIRNQGHSIMEAINRQLAHYSYHVGQIVYIGRMIKGDEWQSLSIPRGRSAEYNNEKFSMLKSKKHFTDDLLDDIS